MNYGKRHPRVTKSCLTCGSEFVVIYARRHKNFCTAVCGYKEISRQRKLSNPQGFQKGTQVSLGRKWTEKQKRARGLLWANEKNPKYKSGYSSHYFKERILNRDNYTCQKCGNNDKRVLEVDHIKNKVLYPELKYDSFNCMTLCANCHRIKTIEDKDLKEWKSKKARIQMLKSSASVSDASAMAQFPK